MDVAEAIRLERLRIRMSQQDLGKAMGWSRQLVTKIEAGDRHVALDELPLLCRTLRCSLSDLLVDISDEDRAALQLPGA